MSILKVSHLAGTNIKQIQRLANSNVKQLTDSLETNWEQSQEVLTTTIAQFKEFQIKAAKSLHTGSIQPMQPTDDDRVQF